MAWAKMHQTGGKPAQISKISANRVDIFHMMGLNETGLRFSGSPRDSRSIHLIGPNGIGGYRMKRLLLVMTGLFVGFAAGSWTPLGEMAVDGGKTLIAKSDRLSALLGIEENAAPTVGTLSPLDLEAQGLALAINPAIDNTDRWQQVTLFLTSKLTTGNAAKEEKFAQASADEIAQLQLVIAAIEDENRKVLVELSTADANMPETHFMRSYYESNNQWLALFRFMIATNDVPVTQTDLALLAMTLDGHRQKLNEATFMGRMVTAAHRQSVEAMTAGTDIDANQKAIVLDMLDSYNLSFDVEDTLAKRISDFPGYMMLALSGVDITAQANAWDTDTQKLLNDRMLLQQYRQTLAIRLQTQTS